MITEDVIRQSGAPDLSKVLRRIPGLEVMQVTGADFSISMRGDNQAGFNKLLVMANGRSIYEDTQGAAFWKAIPVALPEIKRIEVQKDPASVLYGFNAFDGIINIITKSPEEMKGRRCRSEVDPMAPSAASPSMPTGTRNSAIASPTATIKISSDATAAPWPIAITNSMCKRNMPWEAIPSSRLQAASSM